MKIKTMTFNIHHGKGTDGELNLSRIADVIKESDPDLICLNEVDRCFSQRSGYIDQVSWLADELNMNTAFGATLILKSNESSANRQYGNAFLSRYPIVHEQNHSFAAFFQWRHMEGRAFLETDVQIHKQRIKIFSTHLSLNPFSRISQIDFMVNKMTNDDRPTIILGDFNMKPGSSAWNKFTKHFKDVCNSISSIPLYTFPSSRPARQLDYIFVSRHIHIDSVEVLKISPVASDHLPLQAVLTLN